MKRVFNVFFIVLSCSYVFLSLRIAKATQEIFLYPITKEISLHSGPGTTTPLTNSKVYFGAKLRAVERTIGTGQVQDESLWHDIWIKVQDINNPQVSGWIRWYYLATVQNPHGAPIPDLLRRILITNFFGKPHVGVSKPEIDYTVSVDAIPPQDIHDLPIFKTNIVITLRENNYYWFNMPDALKITPILDSTRKFTPEPFIIYKFINGNPTPIGFVVDRNVLKVIDRLPQKDDFKIGEDGVKYALSEYETNEIDEFTFKIER